MIIHRHSFIPAHLVQGAPDPNGLVLASMVRVVDVDTGADLATCLRVDTDTWEAWVLRRNENGFPVYEGGCLAEALHPGRVRLELRQ